MITHQVLSQQIYYQSYNIVSLAYKPDSLFHKSSLDNALETGSEALVSFYA